MPAGAGLGFDYGHHGPQASYYLISQILPRVPFDLPDLFQRGNPSHLPSEAAQESRSLRCLSVLPLSPAPFPVRSTPLPTGILLFTESQRAVSFERIRGLRYRTRSGGVYSVNRRAKRHGRERGGYIGRLGAMAWDTQRRRLRRALGDAWEGNWVAEDFYKVSAMGVGVGGQRVWYCRV
jgi:hypothetical protein